MDIRESTGESENQRCLKRCNDMIDDLDNGVDLLQADLHGLKDAQKLQLEDLWKEWELELTDELQEQDVSYKNLMAQNTERMEYLEKEKESLTARLEEEQTWRLQVSQQLEKQETANQEALAALKQSDDRTELLRRELEALKEANHQLTTKLHVEEDLKCNSLALHNALSASLETETKKNDSLTVELDVLKQKLEGVEKVMSYLNSNIQKEKDTNATLKGEVSRLSFLLDTQIERNKNIVQSWRLELQNQLERQRHDHQRTFEDMKQSTEVTEALRQELEVTKEANQQLATKLQAEEDLRHNYQSLSDRLSTKLETEVKNNEFLTNEKECLTAELEKERTRRTTLDDELQKQKDAHMQENEAMKKSTAEKLDSLVKVNSELKCNLQTEKDVNQSLKEETARLSTALEAQIENNKNLSKRREYDNAKIQNEQSWRQALQNQLEREKLAQEEALKALSESSSETEALHQELEVLKGTNKQLACQIQVGEDIRCNAQALSESLTTALETETQKNDCLIKENEYLTKELEKEQIWRQELGAGLQKQMTDRLQESEALRKSKNQVSELNHDIQQEKAVNDTLRKDILELSIALETRERENDKTKQQEQSWRLALQNQLEKERLDHQRALETLSESSKETETLRQELESLREANQQLTNKLTVEKNARCDCKALGDSLPTATETETKCNENLTKENQSLKAELEQVGAELREYEVLNKTTADKLDSLEKLNSVLNQNLRTQKGVSENMRSEASKLSTALETQIKNNKNLSIQREYDLARLQKEHNWRLDLQNQLEKQRLVNQEALDALAEYSNNTKALPQELEIREKANQGLLTKPRVEEDLMCKSQALTEEKASLITELEKEQKLRNQLFEGLQKEKDAYLQEYKALKKSTTEKIDRLENLISELDQNLQQEKRNNETLKEGATRHSVALEILQGVLESEKLAHQKALEQTSKETEALRQELESLSKVNQQLSTRLGAEEGLRRHSQALADKLSTALETETKKNNCLAKENDSLAMELEKEETWKLQLERDLQKHKDAHEVLKTSSSEKLKSLEKVISELKTNLHHEKNVNETLRGECSRLSITLETERRTYDRAKMEDKSWRLEIQNQLEKEKLEHQRALDAELNAHKKVTESLSNKLEMENKKNELLVQEKECLAMELEKELNWRQRLKDELQEQKDVHLQESKALEESTTKKLKSLQNVISELSHKLEHEKIINETLGGETSRLSAALETQADKSKTLSKQRENDAAKLQQERNLRIQLQEQLEKEKDVHQDARDSRIQSSVYTQTLHKDMEALREANNEFFTKLQAEVELGHERQALIDRLFTNMKAEIKKNQSLRKDKESLMDELKKEQSLTLQQGLHLQRQTDVFLEETETLKMSTADKLKDLENLNSELRHHLQAEKEVNGTLREETFRLSVALETQSDNHKKLVKQTEYDIVQLQREHIWKLEDLRQECMSLKAETSKLQADNRALIQAIERKNKRSFWK